MATETTETVVPKDFKKVANDFINDLLGTFPEYKLLVDRWWDPSDETKVENLYTYCLTMYPENMMNILYQKTEIFTKDATTSTEFLPGISFKYLWNADITEKTKETLWKYLQLMLMTMSGSLLQEGFTNSGKLFENVDEAEFKAKWEETIEKIDEIFNHSSNEEEKREKTSVPTASEMYNNLSGMMDSKLGQLAKEIAEDTMGDLNLELDNVGDAKDLMKKLFENPTKMMSLVKNVSDKLDSKIKSGDINQKELFEEATGMMSKMKDIPGLQGMLESLGGQIPGLGKNTKLDLNAMKNKLSQQNMREHVKKNIEKKKSTPAVPIPNTSLEKEWNLDEILASLDWDNKKKETNNSKESTTKSSGKKGKKK